MSALLTLVLGIPLKILTLVRLFPYRKGWKDENQILAIKVCGDWEIKFEDMDGEGYNVVG